MRTATFGSLLVLLLAFQGAASAAWYTRMPVVPNPSPGTATGVGYTLAAFGNDVLVGTPRPPSGGPGDGVVHLMTTDGALVRTFTPPPGGPDRFGYSVAAVGGNVAVGALGTTGDGAAYLFDGATGALLQTFMPPIPGTEFFGFSVAAFGSNVLVGSTDAVYLFDSTTGSVLHTLTAPGSMHAPALAVIGTTVFVGAPQGDLGGPEDGLVHRFDGLTGNLLGTTVDPDPVENGAFGRKLAPYGANVLVGDELNDGTEGIVYILDGTSGAVLHTIPNPTPSTFFGMSVVGLGNDFAVGLGWASFTVLVFDGSTMTLKQTLESPPGHFSTLFGASLAAAGDRLVVGAQDILFGAGEEFYVFDPCGNGIRSPYEHCDDGNDASGDGCSSECRLELCGTSPAAGCIRPTPQGASVLSMGFGVKRNKLTWKWLRGGATDPVDLGDPTDDTDYELCFYDSGATQPVDTFAALAGSLWAPKSSGFKYNEQLGRPDGLTKVVLKAGPDGAAKITVKGKGYDLLPLGVPFQVPAIVQLHNTSTGTCWESQFTTGELSLERFVARGN